LTRWGACWFTLCIFYFMSTHSHFPTHRLPYDMKPAARALPLPTAPTHERRTTPADQETNGKRRFSMTFDGKPFATKILKASSPTDHSWDTEQDIRFSSGSSMQRRAPKPPRYVHIHTPFDCCTHSSIIRISNIPLLSCMQSPSNGRKVRKQHGSFRQGKWHFA
jgi:hypothetical protein